MKINDSTLPSYPMDRTFDENSTINLEAQPMNGYEFIGWGGDLEGNENPLSIIVESNMTVIAIFSEIKHTLNVEINGSGHTLPSPGDYIYEEGNIVEVTAIPDSGWQFDGWSGDLTDTSAATVTVMMDADKQIIADFSQIMHELVINSNGSGSTIPSVGTYSYPEGTEVQITAEPDSGWKLDAWDGDEVSPESAVITVTMDSDKMVTANFTQNTLNSGIIGIIAGTTGAGLAAFFATRRQSSKRQNHRSN